MIRTEIQPGVWLDSRLGLFLEEYAALVVADLHWGYAASHRHQGNLLPDWGDEEISERLRSLLIDYQPKYLVWLGDSLHTLAGGQNAEVFLREISSHVAVQILAGNHDRRWAAITGNAWQLGGFFLHHGDTPLVAPEKSIEIIGHHHPAYALWDGAGSRVKIPALIAGPRRFVLPAFSPWAAGSPWNGLHAADEKVWAVSPKRIFAVRSDMTLTPAR
ncbi:MAG TPA: metallophosphoesterase [Opitutaceae bacterium]|nr:metallophosphoesterase [Opitutaceae bacterium]